MLEQANTSGGDAANRRRADRRSATSPVADLLDRIEEGDGALLAVLPFVDEGRTRRLVEGLRGRAFDPTVSAERRARLASLATALSSSAEHMASLVEQLSDADEGVRATAASALGSRGNADAVDALLLAVKDPSPRVRRAAVRALCDVGGPAGNAALTAMLEMDNQLDEELLRVALQGFRGGAPERVEPMLLAHLTHPCVDVRVAALSALRELRSLRVTTSVRPLLSDADVRVRLLALSVLERHGGRSDSAAVQERLADPDARVRAMARDAVRALSGEAAV